MYYTNGEKTIYASQKAYDLLYKEKGYKCVDEEAKEPVSDYKALKEEAKRLGIPNYSKMKKEDLQKAIDEMLALEEVGEDAD